MGVRFGLVGTGYWAREVPGASLAGHPGVDLAGVWGRDRAKTGDVAATLGATGYDTPDALFADVDAVAFAVPPAVQAALAVRAAAAGCHLLLEKPVAATAADAWAVADAVATAGVAGVVFFTRRFDPASEEWLDRARAAGGWTGGYHEMVGNIFEPGNPFGDSPWRRDLGALWDVGPHALANLVPVLGAVTAVAATAGPGDTTHLVLWHAGGATSTATLSLTAPAAAGGQSLHLYGEQGRRSAPMTTTDAVACHRRAVDALGYAAARGEPHPCDVRFGAAVVDVLEAAQHSRATGSPQPVPHRQVTR